MGQPTKRADILKAIDGKTRTLGYRQDSLARLQSQLANEKARDAKYRNKSHIANLQSQIKSSKAEIARIKSEISALKARLRAAKE